MANQQWPRFSQTSEHLEIKAMKFPKSLRDGLKIKIYHLQNGTLWFLVVDVAFVTYPSCCLFHYILYLIFTQSFGLPYGGAYSQSIRRC